MDLGNQGKLIDGLLVLNSGSIERGMLILDSYDGNASLAMRGSMVEQVHSTTIVVVLTSSNGSRQRPSSIGLAAPRYGITTNMLLL